MMMDRDDVRLQMEKRRLADSMLSVSAVVCDVSDAYRVNESVKACLAELGGFDILVSNAGILHVGSILETGTEDFRRLIATNVEGPFNIVKAILPSMVERKAGVLLQIASVSSIAPLTRRFGYAVTKAASQMIARSVAHDMAAHGIRANSICPARVETELNRVLMVPRPGQTPDERLAELHALQPLGRMIRTEEVAALALYLCSDEAAMVSGASYLIDGGLFAGV